MAHSSAPRPWRCPQDHTCPAPSHDTRAAYNRGCPSELALRDRRRYTKLHKQGRQDRRRPVEPYRRRLRALAAIGWSWVELSTRTGLNWHCLSEIASDRSHRLEAVSFLAIERVYDQLQGTPGPSKRARTWAAKRGWSPPLAWDDDTIDDPHAGPVHMTRLHPLVERAAGLTEKVQDLTRAGLSAQQIAEHLHITKRSVERHRARLASDLEGVA